MALSAPHQSTASSHSVHSQQGATELCSDNTWLASTSESNVGSRSTSCHLNRHRILTHATRALIFTPLPVISQRSTCAPICPSSRQVLVMLACQPRKRLLVSPAPVYSFYTSLHNMRNSGVEFKIQEHRYDGTRWAALPYAHDRQHKHLLLRPQQHSQLQSLAAVHINVYLMSVLLPPQELLLSPPFVSRFQSMNVCSA